MKKITLLLSVLSILSISISSCKKKGCTNSKAKNYDSKAKKDDGSCLITVSAEQEEGEHGVQVRTYPINDTIDFSTTGNTSDTSVFMSYQGVTTNTALAYYSITSHDSTNNWGEYNYKCLRLNSANGAKVVVDDYVNIDLTRFNLGDNINVNTPNLGNTSSSPSSSFSILANNNYSPNFALNDTQYIGLIFEENGDYYYGWLKIKTFNNYHSCIIQSYSVSEVANQQVTITE